MKKAEIKLLIEDDTVTFESDNMEQIGGPCPIKHAVDPCPQDGKLCWKHYLESEVR